MGVGWAVEGVGKKPEAGITFQKDCYICVQEILIIGLNKPGGPKRRLTNTGVNIRPIPPI